MSKKLMSLDEVIGHRSIVEWFASCISRDRLPQVILFQGPTGIGKTSMAKIVACEIACIDHQSKLEETKKAVIQENKNTDCVKLYNMSNLKSQDAVIAVKDDLNVGFSSTGRKVIIMDEAHGMSDEAQDSLLVTFESLPVDVYVIICTTEIESFRDAFLSRCVLRRLRNLSASEMRLFLERRIKENNLKFELPMNMVYTLLSNYTGREPRRAINLLDSFEPGALVTTKELETFINVFEGKQIMVLVQYLYQGDILLGLDFINEMEISPTFSATLLDMVCVAQNGQSSLIGNDATIRLRELVDRHGLNNLLGFTVDITTRSRLTRHNIQGLFLKWCKKSDELFSPPKAMDQDSVRMQDLAQMNMMMEQRPEVYSNSQPVQTKTLEQLFSESDTLED